MHRRKIRQKAKRQHADLQFNGVDIQIVKTFQVWRNINIYFFCSVGITVEPSMTGNFAHISN